MTSIAAVKKGKFICIASDGLATFGLRKEEEKHIFSNGKLIDAGENIIGASGHHSLGLMLSHHFSSAPAWESSEEVFEAFSFLHQKLKATRHLSPATQFLDFESSNFEALIINPYGIFEIDHSRVVRKYDKYSAIGTGEYYALGSIYSIYDTTGTAKDIALNGVRAAAVFDKKTGGPFYARVIKAREKS